MRALRLLVVLLILLVARTGLAALSDPGELVEASKVNPEVVQEDSAWRKMTKVTNSVTTAVTNTVTSTVQSIFDQGMGLVIKATEIVTPNKPTAKAATGTTAAPTGLAEAAPAVATEPATPALPPPTAAEISALKSQLGSAPKMEAAESLEEIRQQIKNQSPTKVIRQAKKPGANLKLSKAGVPFFPLEIKQITKLKNGKTKVVMAPLKKIPKLDVGQEPLISRQDFLLKEYKFPLREVEESQLLASPTLVGDGPVRSVKAMNVLPAPPAVDLEKGRFGIDKVISHESIMAAMPKIKSDIKVGEKPYRELTEAQQKMLAAAILFAKGDRCHVLLGLLDELSSQDRVGSEATYFLGACAQNLKMYSLGFERLTQLIRAEDAAYARLAIDLLINDMPAEFEVSFSKVIRDLKNEKLVSEKLRDKVNYFTAKGAFKEGDYTQARTFAEKVSESSTHYAEAQYIVGIAWYSLGNMAKAEGKLDTLRQYLGKKQIADKNLNSVSAINLARIKFRQGRYKDALNLYLAVDKDHPLWVQGLVEQGWTQLAVDDFSGAIGNMYSLHSPYFKAVYKPESFVVRTIGYLNICQYGDAYRTLSWLEHEYRPWIDQINTYVGSKKLASEYYETAVQYLRGKSDQEVDGLPYQVIREAARQRGFLNFQSSLNNKADEVGRYDLIENRIREEKVTLRGRIDKATRRFKEFRVKIQQAEKDRNLTAQANEWKRLMRIERETVISLRYQVSILDSTKTSFQNLKTNILARIEKERYNLREGAGRNLVSTLMTVKSDLTKVLDNNEFLRYEVFSGSGENIRYQVAGGEIAQANRLPASVKPQKLMNWSFDGEYWEDEIGSYRSSLQNNCPETGRMTEYFKQKESEGHEVVKGEGQ